MKAKSLIGLAVAGALGCSTAVAGIGYEVATPYSPSESGNVALTQTERGSDAPVSVGSISGHGGGMIGGGTDGESLTLTMDNDVGAIDDHLVLMDGTVTEYYLVSWTPATTERWDAYMIEPLSGHEMIVLLEDSAPIFAFEPVGTVSPEVMGEVSGDEEGFGE